MSKLQRNMLAGVFTASAFFFLYATALYVGLSNPVVLLTTILVSIGISLGFLQATLKISSQFKNGAALLEVTVCALICGIIWTLSYQGLSNTPGCGGVNQHLMCSQLVNLQITGFFAGMLGGVVSEVWLAIENGEYKYHIRYDEPDISGEVKVFWLKVVLVTNVLIGATLVIGGLFREQIPTPNLTTPQLLGIFGLVAFIIGLVIMISANWDSE